jgi:uncharacterized protein YndB with AHSA1/START domain
MERTVTREVVLDTTAEDVWALLTDSTELGSWLGDEVRLDPTPGGAAHIREGDGTVRVGRVTLADKGRQLGFRWWPADDEAMASTVTFTLAEEGDRTRLTVVETLASTTGASTGGTTRACLLADAGELWDDRLLGLERRLLGRPVPVPALA